MKTKLTLFIFAAFVLLSSSCTKYPPTSERLLEDLAVLTQYNTKINFSNYKTYAIANSIAKITDKDTVYLTDANAQAVLSQIDKNMQARNFVKVTGVQVPDLGIQVLYFQNTYVYTYYYYDYWYGYYPYYPYYPTYYASYSAGTACIDLIDLKNVGADNRLSIEWNAYIRGLLTGDHTTYDVTQAVDQAFIQTPQLVTNAK